MFADNKFIYLGKAFQQIDKELRSVSMWLKASKLSINIDKTKWTIFIPLLKSVLCLQNFQNYSLMK